MPSICDRDIGLEWYQYGLEKGDDFFTRFMMHWVAFNWLYNMFDGKFEWKRIKNFAENNAGKLSAFNAFDIPEFQVFALRPIRDGRTGEIGEVRQNRFQKVTDKKSIPHLLLTLYQVRCNLFHGAKSLCDARDVELVKSSAVILEGYLKAYFEHSINRERERGGHFAEHAAEEQAD